MTDDIRIAETDADVAACFPVMRQLRPHLTSPEELVTRWRRQTQAGYRLMALWRDGKPMALAGFRIEENLVHGRFLYVDDLVTADTARSGGHGHALMERLKAETRAAGCARLVLDTPLTNVAGHRFYYRERLVATALRFGIALGQG